MDFESRKPETRAQRVGPLCEEQCHGNLRLRTYEGIDERQGENGGGETHITAPGQWLASMSVMVTVSVDDSSNSVGVFSGTVCFMSMHQLKTGGRRDRTLTSKSLLNAPLLTFKWANVLVPASPVSFFARSRYTSCLNSISFASGEHTTRAANDFDDNPRMWSVWVCVRRCRAGVLYGAGR
jgi:hypothetical protein